VGKPEPGQPGRDVRFSANELRVLH